MVTELSFRAAYAHQSNEVSSPQSKVALLLRGAADTVRLRMLNRY